MSTAMMAKKMNDQSDGEFYVIARGDGEYADSLENVDLILVGPQVRHMIPSIKKEINQDIPISSINPRYYGTMNAKAVLEEAKKIIDQHTR